MGTLAMLIPVLGPILDKIFTRFIPDPEARTKAVQDTLAMFMQSDLAQIDVNREEAKAGAFRGGWRPAIGWVCATALAFQYLFVPLATWVATMTGDYFPPPPALDGMLWELMFGMLGMGALRSFEKIKKLQ